VSFINELKRRNVFRAGTAYVIGAWLIIQVIETVFPAFGFGDSAIRIAVIVLAVGFVPAVVLAWAFELTPTGLIPEKEVDHSSPTLKKFGKRLDRLIMVVLALALGYFAFDKFVLDPARDEAIAKTAREEARTEVTQASRNERVLCSRYPR
jgi:formate hydrogenlyase subunit 3/multisubunit Na+/H+ antiporter MnhD subunit